MRQERREEGERSLDGPAILSIRILLGVFSVRSSPSGVDRGSADLHGPLASVGNQLAVEPCISTLALPRGARKVTAGMNDLDPVDRILPSASPALVALHWRVIVAVLAPRSADNSRATQLDAGTSYSPNPLGTNAWAVTPPRLQDAWQ